MINLSLWVLLLPLLGFIVLGLTGRIMSRGAVLTVAWLACGLAFVFALGNFFSMLGNPVAARVSDQTVYTWVLSGSFQLNFGLLYDPLSATMLLIVTGVGLLIHIYSAGYMEDDPGFWRFFCYMNFFIFAMVLLVAADNFLFLLIGWGLVGLASFLLIGFWYQRRAPVAAARKAFVINVIGDFGLLLAIFLIFEHYGTLNYQSVFGNTSALAAGSGPALAICLLLFVACAAKSAQLPLYMWLPDAMEGPTPVSALIHAATMVTAGVFLIGRMHAVYLRAPLAMDVVAVTGAVTAIFAAASALVEPDLKRVLAYSTISQLGYMFLAVGVGAWGAGIFHLTSHAFFKALLFLAAGSVMHALGGTTDMRRMGGLARPLPWTAATFGIGALALAGIPPFAGFFSKDQILSAAFHRGDVALWAVGLAAAGLTAVYIVRAFVLTFLTPAGPGPRPDRRGPTTPQREPAAGHAAPHEAPPIMGLPIQALAALTVLGGALGLSFTQPGALDRFLAPVVAAGGPDPAGGGEGTLIAVSVTVALAGVAAGWLIYGTGTLRGSSAAVRAWLSHQFYVEDFFNAVVAAPARGLAWAFDLLDREGVDGAVMSIGRMIGWGGGRLRRVQSGYLRQYAAILLIGVTVLLAYWVSR